MCVYFDVALNGLLRSPTPLRLVKPDSAAISDIRLLRSPKYVRLVKPDSAEISDIWLL